MIRPSNPSAQYGVALLCVVGALLIRWTLDPWLGNQIPFVTVFGAVAMATWFGGWRPGVVSAVLGFVGVVWLFLPPERQFTIYKGLVVGGGVGFAVSSGLIIFFGEAMRRAQFRAQIEAAKRAKSEEIERRERELLDVTLSSIGDGVIVTDTRGIVTFLNPVAEALTGWPAEEACGQRLERIFLIVNEITRQPVVNPAEHVLRDGVIVGLANHTTLLARNGREIPIADSAAPIRDASGQITGVVMVFRDQTDERLAEARLRESEARKTAVLATALDGIVGMDAGGLITDFNAAAENMFGFCASDVIGRPLSEVFIPERFRAAHNRGLAHYLASGEGPVLDKRLEMPALRADGVEVLVELSIHRIPGSEPAAFSGFLRDITERTRAEAALRASESQVRALLAEAEAAKASAEAAKDRAESATRAKDEFLAQLSHELRTPLSPALLLSRELAEDESLPKQARSSLEIIARGIALQARLIDDMLDVSRIASGKLRLDLRAMDAHEALRHACDIVTAEAHERQITLTLDIAAERHVIYADAVRIQQVFWNVLKNAIKFTPSGGRVTVRTHNPDELDNFIRVEVTDTGVGIEPAMLGRVFDAFAQEDHNYKFGGLGLGLAISQRLVEMQEGRISVASPGRDLGTTFTIEFPFANSVPADDALLPHPLSTASPAKHRILLVEDHDSTRTTLVLLLRRRGHYVVDAATAAQALTLAAADSFDLVVSDLGLPDGDGQSLMAALRDTYGLTGIALSGYGMEDDLARSRDSGFYTHLIKPVELGALEAAIAAAPISGSTKV